MTIRKSQTIIILCLTTLLFINTSTAQQNDYVRFGERPPVDLGNLPLNAYEKGRFKIKLNRMLEESIPPQSLDADTGKFVKTGNHNLDRLNRLIGVKSYKPLFGSLYETNSKTSEYSERHRQWGFHLWFELVVDEHTNIIDAVKQFALLDEIDFAEPEYLKRLVINDPFMGSANAWAGGEIPGGLRWTSNDPQFNNQWHYHNTGQQNGTPGSDISVMEAWDFEKGNPNVIVAIIDGGIDHNHSDLAANMWQGIGYNFVNNSFNINAHFHGTHVAGTVAGVSNNNIGVAGIAGGSGTGNGIRLMSCQVFTNTSNGGFHIAPVYAADNGAAISQNSWGYNVAGVYDQAILDAIDYFNVNGGGNALNGGISIFAAGNSNASGQWYPAVYSGCFSVAATNNQDKRAWYSNYDTWVDISAPGGETHQITSRGVLSTLVGNTYGYLQGTSMACPHVSGTAALLVSLAYGELTSNQLADILRNTTDDHYAVNQAFIGMLGTGRLNAGAALNETLAILSGIANPNNFVANALSTDEIYLTWNRNFNNNNVMITWSADSAFGVPQDGRVYSAGEQITGGGIVLYIGDATAFNHTGLDPATFYFYKAYSINPENAYSTGRTAVAGTLCSKVSALPFLENFNLTQNLPSCWNIVDHIGNGQTWQIGTTYGGVSGSGGYYAFINSDAYGSGNSQNTDLVTPTLNLSAYTDVTLNFQHYFRVYSSSSAKLYYSINNGSTWVLIQSWTVNTANPAQFSQQIPELAGESEVKIKWNYTGTYGYYWSVDNIGISGTPTNLILGDVVFSSTLDTCMSSTQSIMVAGAGTTFVVENGANVELVAGQSIFFFEGTHIQPGSHFQGRIASNGDYCLNTESKFTSNSIAQEALELPLDKTGDTLSFTLFPNPTRELFLLTLPNSNYLGQSLVSVYSLIGEKIIQIELNEQSHVFDLSNMPGGVYIIRIMCGEKVGVGKIIKQ